jgi:hypothetical protein
MLPFQFGLSLGWVDATLGSIMWLYRHMLMWTYPVRSMWTHPIQLSAHALMRMCAIFCSVHRLLICFSLTIYDRFYNDYFICLTHPYMATLLASLSYVMARTRRYLVYSRLLVLVEKARSISHYFTRFLNNARILYVMARTRRDVGSNRFFSCGDL